jgi:hypothetical protein
VVQLMISSWCSRKNWTHSSHANGLKVFFAIIVVISGVFSVDLYS